MFFIYRQRLGQSQSHPPLDNGNFMNGIASR
jgi:hypothetical protein